jgi:hypothetical protein
MGRPASGQPPGAHEWVSFDDPGEERTWVFDVTFLLSPWTCIFGRGCQGVLTSATPELAQGCCSYGAHFSEDDDAARVEAAAATLTDDQWQFRRQGTRRGVTKTDRSGATVTRMVQGACIFLNRPDFHRGPGCALHVAAVDRSQRPLELKPNVCWQLPLRREDVEDGNGHVTSTLRQWDRRHWGEGGGEFHWWCTESPDAFVSREAVYRHMREELVEMVGEYVYDQLAAYLDARSTAGVALPHPAVRRP